MPPVNDVKNCPPRAAKRAALVWKELRGGFLNGISLSFAAIGWYLLWKGCTVGFSFAVSGCLGAAMLPAMVISALSGTWMPIF